MELVELFESLDSPITHYQDGPRHKIEVDNEIYTVYINTKIINGFHCKSLLFTNSKDSMDTPLNKTPGHARKVFTNIIDIVKKFVLPCDLIFILPDDSKISIKEKKYSLYHAIALRLQNSGLIAEPKQFTIVDKKIICAIPSMSKCATMSDYDIADTAAQFALHKLSTINGSGV